MLTWTTQELHVASGVTQDEVIDRVQGVSQGHLSGILLKNTCFGV